MMGRYAEVLFQLLVELPATLDQKANGEAVHVLVSAQKDGLVMTLKMNYEDDFVFAGIEDSHPCLRRKLRS